LGTFRPQAVNNQISLTTDLVDNMVPIEADTTLLRQAIANLVDNALKYTPAKGSVVISAFQEDDRQYIKVTDTGLGIAPTDQARLFEKFYRARRQESLQVKGTGLGLAIVKSIVEQHEGRVTLESKLGSGSTFTIDIPIQQAVRDEQPESAGER
jgi:signal transduction histidine kinase